MLFRSHSKTPHDGDADADADVAWGMRVAAAWSWRILLVAAVVALVGYLVVTLRLIVIPVAVAIMLASLLVPFCGWLRRHGWPKGLAVALSMIAVVIVVGGLVTLIVFQVRGSLPDLQSQTAARWNDLTAFLLASPLHLTQADINGYGSSLLSSLQADSSTILNGALTVGTTAGHLLAGALITLFTTLFILLDGPTMWRWVVRLFPKRARPAVDVAGRSGWITLSTFVKVQIFVAFIDAVGIGLGAFILGLFTGGFPLVIPIAVAVFLGSFIPVVGAVVTGAVAVFVALLYLGPVPALIMLGIVVLVQQLEGHVLQPFIMGTAVKVHPVAVVLSVAAFSFLAGIPGALFAVPLVATLNVMIGSIARGEWRTTPPAEIAAADARPRKRTAARDR